MMEADKNNSLIIGKTLLQHTSNPSKIDKEEYNWIPIKLEKYDPETGYQWLDDRPSSCGGAVMNPKWGKAQPNALGINRCAQAVQWLDGEFWDDTDCDETHWSICNVPITQTYLLRGHKMINQTDKTRYHFDHVYTLSLEMQLVPSEVVFEGQGQNQIIWYPLRRKTQIRNHDNWDSIVEFEQHPFGLLKHDQEEHGLIFTNVRHLLRSNFLS